MASLKMFLTFFLFLFFFSFYYLPHITATTCPRSTCASHSPPIRFPFQLANRQLSSCAYPGFDLSCNDQKQTILTLPSSGDFIVQGINYKEQIVTNNDPEDCLLKRFLDGAGDNFNLKDSPFTFWIDARNYTFLNCSLKDGTWAGSISCLSDDNYKVLLVPTPDRSTAWTPCSIISTAFLPIYSFQWRDLDDILGIHLSWDEPNCRSCEAGGLRCEFENATSSQVRCSDSSQKGYGIMIGVGIPGMLFIIWIGLHFCDRIGRVRDRLHRRQSITELSIAVDREVRPPLVTVGLVGPTIESYPKIQLDESLELPEPDDKTCSICCVITNRLKQYEPYLTATIIFMLVAYMSGSGIIRRALFVGIRQRASRKQMSLI